MSENIAVLVDALPLLPAKDQGFAASLISQHGKKGLSPKQWYWVNELANRANGTATPVATTQVGNMSAIVEMLNFAKGHLKFPAILVAAENQTLKLNIAGKMAKVPGSINVCSSEKDATGQRNWFGRVTPEGEFQPSRKFPTETQTAIASALIALANDPAKAASDYGHMTGSCCFCGKTLTDERSTSVGYGPICAGHFNLPWGDSDD
jgi:Family of unknown function (DUF6011)